MAATSEPVPQNLADVTALLAALPGFAEVLLLMARGAHPARSPSRQLPARSRIATC